MPWWICNILIYADNAGMLYEIHCIVVEFFFHAVAGTNKSQYVLNTVLVETVKHFIKAEMCFPKVLIF